MSVAINVLSSLFSSSTLASAAWSGLSTPVQAAIALAGIGSAGCTAHSVGKRTILSVANYRKNGAKVFLPCGNTGRVSKVGFDFIEAIRDHDDTIVTVRGDDLENLRDAEFKRDPEAGAKARERVQALRSKTIGERRNERLGQDDRQLSDVKYDNIQLTGELGAAKQVMKDQRAKFEARFENFREEIFGQMDAVTPEDDEEVVLDLGDEESDAKPSNEGDASSPEEGADESPTQEDEVNESTPALKSDAIKAKVKAAAAVAESADEAVEAAEAELDEALEEAVATAAASDESDESEDSDESSESTEDSENKANAAASDESKGSEDSDPASAEVAPSGKQQAKGEATA